MKRNSIQPGDQVVCRITKRSKKPGPRAINVRPDPNGDGYTYQVDKLWLVERTGKGDEMIVRTRRGKRHVIKADNPLLRKPNLIERIIYRSRFPQNPQAFV